MFKMPMRAKTIVTNKTQPGIRYDDVRPLQAQMTASQSQPRIFREKLRNGGMADKIMPPTTVPIIAFLSEWDSFSAMFVSLRSNYKEEIL